MYYTIKLGDELCINHVQWTTAIHGVLSVEEERAILKKAKSMTHWKEPSYIGYGFFTIYITAT